MQPRAPATQMRHVNRANARVIISPGHLKRMIRALQDNLAKYEAKFGPIIEASPPEPDTLTN